MGIWVAQKSSPPRQRWSLSKRSVNLSTRAAQEYPLAPVARGFIRNCAGAGVLSPGLSKRRVRRELASVSTGVLVGVLFSISSMIAKRKNRKRQRSRAKKKCREQNAKLYSLKNNSGETAETQNVSRENSQYRNISIHPPKYEVLIN